MAARMTVSRNPASRNITAGTRTTPVITTMVILLAAASPTKAPSSSAVVQLTGPSCRQIIWNASNMAMQMTMFMK